MYHAMALNPEHINEKFWPYATQHVDTLWVKAHTKLMKPSLCDRLAFGEKLEAKLREWKRQCSTFEPVTEPVIWLGRDLSLAGDGGVMLSITTGNVRHAQTVVKPGILYDPPPEAIEVETGEFERTPRNPQRRIRGKTPADEIAMTKSAI